MLLLAVCNILCCFVKWKENLKMETILKIIIIGSPGAGKSTFARKLRDMTKLPLYYLDMLWHKPDGTNVSREEFDKGLREILNNDSWIMDFSKDQLPQIHALLEKYQKDKNIVIFRSRKEADDYLETLLKQQ